MSSEWSMPKTCPRVANLLSSRTAMPGPKPTSKTRSVGCTSSSDTAQRLRSRFEDRWLMTNPANRPSHATQVGRHDGPRGGLRPTKDGGQGTS